MGLNALSTSYPSIANCIKTDVRVSNPYSGEETNTLAIWDTGATGSVITRSKALELGLTEINKKVVKGVHGAKEVPVYVVKITLNNENISVPAYVTECDELSASGDTGMLIGMDIISMGDFAISNFGGRTLMTFRVPSIRETNYVEELSVYNRCVKMHELNIQHHRADKCACGSGKLFHNCHGKYIPDGIE